MLGRSRPRRKGPHPKVEPRSQRCEPSNHVCRFMLVIGKVVSGMLTVQSPPPFVECKPLPKVNDPETVLPLAKLLPVVVTRPDSVPVVVWPDVLVIVMFNLSVVLPMPAGAGHVIVDDPWSTMPMMPLQRTSFGVVIVALRLPLETKPPV